MYVATKGKDGKGLKLEQSLPFGTKYETVLTNRQNSLWYTLPAKIQ